MKKTKNAHVRTRQNAQPDDVRYQRYLRGLRRQARWDVVFGSKSLILGVLFLIALSVFQHNFDVRTQTCTVTGHLGSKTGLMVTTEECGWLNAGLATPFAAWHMDTGKTYEVKMAGVLYSTILDYHEVNG